VGEGVGEWVGECVSEWVREGLGRWVSECCYVMAEGQYGCCPLTDAVCCR
jgi:hypothetical protein